MIWKILGILFLIKCLFKLMDFLTRICVYIQPMIGMKYNLKKHGSWAVVTGATDGIGKAIANELARKRGLNLVLISRTQSKLDDVAKELSEKWKIEVKTLQFDFSKSDSNYESIKNGLKGLDVSLLVNNVGISYDHPEYFLEYDSKVYDVMVNMNIKSVLEMTRIVMEEMLQRGKGGVVVHLSSSSSFFPVPLLNVYAASKVFVNYFGEALSYEYQKRGIKSQVVAPYYVATKLSKMKPSGVLVPSPEMFARQMVASIGLNTLMCGYLPHEMLSFFLAMLPTSFVIRHTLKLMGAIRKKWYKRQAQKKE